jgi:hypothetical protein
VLVFIILTRRLKDRLQFVQSQYREETAEQQEQCKEYPDGSQEDSDVNERWVEHAPARWNEVTVQ